MTEEALLESQVTYLYNAAAKGLYNLALYSVQNQPLAEQLTSDAFASAFGRLSEKLDVEQFRIKCAESLYRLTKKSMKRANGDIGKQSPMFSEDIKSLECENTNRITALLTRLEFEERYILLLFFHQKYSVKQISQIMSLPTLTAKNVM